MSKPTIRIHNVETNEVIDREMNDQEFAIFKSQQTAQAAIEAEAEAKAAQRQAIADRLGLTAEELKVLLG